MFLSLATRGALTDLSIKCPQTHQPVAVRMVPHANLGTYGARRRRQDIAYTSRGSGFRHILAAPRTSGNDLLVSGHP